MAISVSQIQTPPPYSPNEVSLLNASSVESVFNPSVNYIEYIITDSANSFKLVDINYNRYSFPTNGTVTSNNISSIILDPTSDIQSKNINAGEYIVYYNFYQNEVNTSPTQNNFFVKEISSDRTEVTISFLSLFTSLEGVVSSLKIDNSPYFKEFYLNFGNGIVLLANNIQVGVNNTLVINLYDPLPFDIQINASFWIVTKIADTLSFNISITPETILPTVVKFDIKGPNLNLNIKDRTNNSTDYVDYSTLFQNQLTSSISQIESLFSEKQLEINIDYTDFSNFIHFSSAETRINNFYYKVSQIESLNNEINILNTSPSTIFSSQSIYTLQTKINNFIKNFDGYEYYLYYDSGSWSWPKSTSTVPYTLYSTGSIQVTNWLTGILNSASIYDNENQDYLYYAIPEYLRDDTNNSPYFSFIQLVGQYYDNIYVYYKDVTNRYNADNRLDYGISKDLVAEALKSFGIKLYQNNFSTNDLYSAFLGFGAYSPEITGSVPVTSNSFQEYISNYVTASYEASVTPLDDVNKEIYKRLYHNLPYLLKTKGTIPGLQALINCFGIPDTVLRISEFGGRDKDTSTYDYFYDRFSYAFAGHSGSNSRSFPQIPWAPLSTAISSSGDGVGYVAYNYVLEDYVYREGGGGGAIPSASLPNNIEFRFKTNGIPSNYNTQSLLIKTNTSHSSAIDDWGIGIFLNYTQPLNASSPYYSGDGSVASDTPTQGNLYFTLNTVYPINIWYESPQIQLPFFDGGWWSVMLQRDKSPFPGEGNDEIITYTLYAANKLYDSEEGNTIGFIASSSIVIDPNIDGDYIYLNEAWNSFNIPSEFTPYEAGIYLGGHYSGSNIGSRLYTLSASFDGYFQEFRYYSLPLDVKTFKDYTMNPTSIEGLQLMGASSSFNILGFRAALGNELWWDDFDGIPEYESPFISTNNNSSDEFQRANSIHPAVYAGSVLTTQSFFNTNTNQSFSDYALIYPYNPNANTPETFYINQQEVYYFDQPIAGIKNRVTDKIQIVSSSYPTGSVLSQYRSLEQDYPSLGSEVPDVNLLEVAFSPQNEVNDDIINQLGYFNIGEYIGDPRDITSREVTYPDLVNLSSDFFKKYFDSYNLFDYIRLIKYFDNSLFKMIQDFVPSRTSLTSGVVIKQHLLERNKYPQPLIEWEDVTYSGSIDTAFIEGSTGGTFDSYNFTGSIIPPTFINNTQSWGEEVKTPVGLLTVSHSTQDEFYNGELPNSIIIVTNGELNEANPFKEPPNITYPYKTVLYSNSAKSPGFGIQLYDITPKENFLNPETSPNGGEIYLWFDDSTYNIGAPEIDGVQYGWDYYSDRFSTEKVKFIKINRIDSNGTNISNILSQCQSITISLPDSVHTYPVYGISSVGNYFLYSIGPYLPVGASEQIGNPNTSSLGEILSYNFLASKTTQQAPIFVPSGVIGEYWTNRIQNFTSITDNSNGSFDITDGSYTFGQTPNKILQVRISGSGVIDPSGTTTINAYMVRNDGSLIETDIINSSYSGGSFDITLVLSSSNAKNYLTENSTFGFGLSRTFGLNYLTCSTFYVSMSLYNTTPFVASQSQTSFDPSLPEGVASFTYNDYNAIVNNALESISSNIFMDVDYSNNPIIPVNQNAILNGIASKAQVQDSNYNSTSWSRIRYKGSKYNSIKIS
jgi:hypothetical protein